MKLINAEYDTESGFAWAYLATGEQFQACLECGKRGKNIKQLSLTENGASWGVCAEINEAIFKKYSAEECIRALARAAGLKLI